jgi:serine/threonine protein kinase
VADWLLLGCHGHGGFGVVYRAVRVGHESEGPVALKMALFPWEPRSMREVGLLSLLQHPSIPRLLGHGFWEHSSGMFFPFVVMEWIEGMSLYEWAREHHPNNAQLFQVLAQLARALEVTHARRAVHRDVKGDNILVRRSDGRAMLMDFGAGHYQSAARITSQPLPPGTPAYRSPEAWLFAVRSRNSPEARYLPGPADDVYALGVTAYRLVTGEYPPSLELRQDVEGTWYVATSSLPAPTELNPRVAPPLSALIVRMLSVSPEARGTAGELAQALEAEAEEVQAAPAPPRPWRQLAAVLLVLWALQAVHVPLHRDSAREQVASTPASREGGAASLGETGAETPVPPVQEPSTRETISQDTPPKPLPGQLTPNAKGQCPGRTQIPINGGCWLELSTRDAEACAEDGYVFFKARCYAPAMGSRRKPPPTSAPPDFR